MKPSAAGVSRPSAVGVACNCPAAGTQHPAAGVSRPSVAGVACPAVGTKHPAAGVRLTIAGMTYPVIGDMHTIMIRVPGSISGVACPVIKQCFGWDHVTFDVEGNVPTARNESLHVRGDVQREWHTLPCHNKGNMHTMWHGLISSNLGWLEKYALNACSFQFPCDWGNASVYHCPKSTALCDWGVGLCEPFANTCDGITFAIGSSHCCYTDISWLHCVTSLKHTIVPLAYTANSYKCVYVQQRRC